MDKNCSLYFSRTPALPRLLQAVLLAGSLSSAAAQAEPQTNDPCDSTSTAANPCARADRVPVGGKTIRRVDKATLNPETLSAQARARSAQKPSPKAPAKAAAASTPK
jgi:hypothetical protein